MRSKLVPTDYKHLTTTDTSLLSLEMMINNWNVFASIAKIFRWGLGAHFPSQEYNIIVKVHSLDGA